jgi:N6-adenosine-specific RNA methylase IME4/ParB-like chromosome segregation protein Spo0J
MSNHLPYHPLADIFPLLEGAEFDELIADVKANRLLEPIVVYDDQILDGRTRYRACLAAGVEPTLRPFDGDDPVAYVISMNVTRRHLDESQRAMVAARVATLKQGARTDLSPIGEMSQAKAAELLNVGKRSVERAVEVRDHGTPELQQAVERGAVSVSAAADVATLPADEQREVVARGEREILEKAKAIRAKKGEARRAEHMARLVEASRPSVALPTGRRFPVIYADPPWDFRNFAKATGSHGSPLDHYATMATADICALRVADLATPDAVLFLWTTNAHLWPDALDVVRAWGFEYKTNLVWVKDKVGVGFWIRTQHELLLVCTRGDMPTPREADRLPSVIQSPRREHSRKPDEVHEFVERMFPDLPRVELFARTRRPGWEAWGAEVGSSMRRDAAGQLRERSTL